MQKHPRQARPRHLIPLAFVWALILSAVAALASPRTAWMGRIVPTAYLVAMAVAVVRAPAELCVKAVLPAAFITLHVSYGTGMTVGLVRHRGWHRSTARAFLGALIGRATRRDDAFGVRSAR